MLFGTRVFFVVIALNVFGDWSAFAQTIETVVVPTDSSTNSSMFSLKANVEYELRATGTFTIGGPGDGLADAEFADFSDPPGSVFDNASTGLDFGMTIDGVKPDWGEFNPNHEYSIFFIGKNSPIAVGYVDSFFSDNFGQLTLAIIEPVLVGDVNCDGAVDLLDVAPFIDVLSNAEFESKADINQDGVVNLLDVGPFVQLLGS